MFFNSHDDDNDRESITLVFPGPMELSIPEAISQDVPLVNGTDLPEGELITNEDLYQNLRAIVQTGESPITVLEDLLSELRGVEIENVVPAIGSLSSSYFSEKDGRRKDITLRQAPGLLFYDYLITAVDEDKSQAAEIAWSVDPDRILATIKPTNLDKTINPQWENVFYRVEYSEEVASDYDDGTSISITGLPQSSGLENLSMLLLRRAEEIDIFGSSYHPDFNLFDPSFSVGRNYNFIVRTNSTLNIGVAALSLPLSTEEGNDFLFDRFSVRLVFNEDLLTAGINDPSIVDPLLDNATIPAYYIGEGGFVSSGAIVPVQEGFTEEFVNLDLLSFTFIPVDVKDMQILFLED